MTNGVAMHQYCALPGVRVYFSSASAKLALSERSANAISGSIIQNLGEVAAGVRVLGAEPGDHLSLTRPQFSTTSADADRPLSVSVNAAIVEPARLLPVGRNPIES